MTNTTSLSSVILLLSIFMLGGCNPSDASESSAGNIRGYNHVEGQNVNWFSVNGYTSTLTGNTCCVMIPDKWRPGLTAHIEWEIDPNPHAHLPPLGTDAYNKAYSKHKAKYRQYSADVPIPEYDQSAGISVHFLPCHQVKVYAGLSSYGASNYPIKEPLNMKESGRCPK
jgi:hypothetical protein